MNNKLLVIIIAVLLGVIGWLLMASPATQSGEQSSTVERKILYWQAPMDANYRRNEPGKSPMGMDLIPVYEDEVDGQPGVVKIDPTVVNNLGVRTAIVARGALPRRIDALAYLGYNEDSLSQINTRIDGWVEKLGVKTSGDVVTKGAVLFEIYSPALVTAQDEYLATLKGNNTVLKQASRKRLLALGADNALVDRITKSGTAERRVRVLASDDGVVTNLDIREGSFVSPGTRLMTLANLDTIWVLTEVFENQANWVRLAKHADIQIDSLPGQVFPAQVDYVYPEIDPVTRTLKVRLRLDNPDRILHPNMYARAAIYAPDTRAVLFVPREAVIRGGDGNRVVLAMGDGRFRSQSVSTGIESGHSIEVTSGLNENDVVVISGQFLIDSESSVSSAFSRFEEPVPASTSHDDVSQMQTDEPQMDHSQMNHDDMSEMPMDHSQMNHDDMSETQMDHSQMNHDDMSETQMDHSQMNHDDMSETQMDHSQMNDAEMNHEQMEH